MSLKSKIEKLLSKWLQKLLKKISPEEDAAIFPLSREASEGGTDGEAVQDRAGDALDFKSLTWQWGGFNGGAAVLVPGCMIADLQVSASRMTYRWTAGGCEMLGAGGATDASCLACLFVRDAAGVWRGGKFDWISTSRTQRGFENIREHGYNGWPKDAIDTATGFAFVIVSKGGDRRTNVIVQEGGVR